MSEEFFPVTETVVFLRIVKYGEGRLGKFAVALVKHQETEFTLLLAEEEFPAEKAQLMKKGQVLKVKPSERGLRARIQDQDIKLLAQNQEDIMLLMERLQRLHYQYESKDYSNFPSRLQFEAYYWKQFIKLTALINNQIRLIKPFLN